MDFVSDWKAELEFLHGCFQKHASGKVQRVFEPGCGTGRLLVRLAKAGYDVAGNDLNPHAVDYCNGRLHKLNLAPTVTVGDMANFQLQRKADVMFNMINTFRHLPDEESAESHLRCVASSLRKGGAYVFGLHLTPTRGPRCGEESWAARRGHLAVLSRIWTIRLDRRKRRELVGMTFDVHTPTKQFQLTEELVFRTYTHQHLLGLLERVRELELVATYDFCYDLDEPIVLDSATEDVVLVLRKR